MIGTAGNDNHNDDFDTIQDRVRKAMDGDDYVAFNERPPKDTSPSLTTLIVMVLLTGIAVITVLTVNHLLFEQ